MELGLKNDEIRLSPFTPEWKDEFLKVKMEIQSNINIDGDRIEHIGSTAIDGVQAKPIIDILVGIDDLTSLDPVIVEGFKRGGFLRLKVERPGEIVFAKFTDNTYQAKTHYIHLVEYEKELWKNLIFFRDYLNSHETERNQYEQIKLEYVNKSSVGINEYTNHKEAFVKQIVKKRIGDRLDLL